MTRFKKQPIPKEMRLAVFERDGYVCRYCGAKTPRPHADHVFPESRGGPTIIENLVTACRKCNIKKRNSVGIWPFSIEKSNEIADRKRLLKSINLQKNVSRGLRKKLKKVVDVPPRIIMVTKPDNQPKKIRSLLLFTLLLGALFSSFYDTRFANELSTLSLVFFAASACVVISMVIIRVTK